MVHGGMTELEEAELTGGQGRALSGHKTTQAYKGYAKGDDATRARCYPRTSCAPADALRMARTSAFDVALLDVNIGGKRADPVTDVIRARGTPIIFVTGYGKTAASGLVLEKPYGAAALKRILSEALGIRHE
jgi:CheY-like chemotaxis protein